VTRAKLITDPWLRDVAKDQTLFLGQVRRWVESLPSLEDEERAIGIHPSELSRDDFCRRASFYENAGRKPHTDVKRPNHRILLIFEEGTSIHEKWQEWAWEMGELVGVFGCIACRFVHGNLPEDWTWWGQSPQWCPSCGAPRPFLKYLEVPVHDPETLIVGHADIRIGMRLGEIKSVGPRSIEFENPRLYERFTREIEEAGESLTLYDLAGMWRNLKRPFLPHARQLQLYLHVTGLDEGFVLYEWKVNQGPKEFPVPYHYPTVEPMLALCADVKEALERDKPPRCNIDPFDKCPRCRAYEEAA
jgi:hypothetical protein